jgi:hypothetical protein
MGFRKYDGTMPLVSTNSRAISAACRVLPEDRTDGYLLPVQWGVVQIKGGVGHAAFTTAHVMKTVEANRKYATKSVTHRRNRALYLSIPCCCLNAYGEERI